MSKQSQNQGDHSPAKINLMLAVHGPREDGFHALTSVVAPLAFGDTLRIEERGDSDLLTCSDPDVPTGADNLVIRAAALFRHHLGKDPFFKFDLEKRIPMGAGLGGGSSNAAVALMAMNRLCDFPFDANQLRSMAAKLGSDCPLFIDGRAALIRGRGEVVELMPEAWQKTLEGQQIVLFKPNFPVPTKWAYGQLLQAEGAFYEDSTTTRRRLAEAGVVSDLLYNSFEPAVGRKYVAITVLLNKLREEGFDVLMSGSGSCCFGLISGRELASQQLRKRVSEAWGEAVFWVETFIHQSETERFP